MMTIVVILESEVTDPGMYPGPTTTEKPLPPVTVIEDVVCIWIMTIMMTMRMMVINDKKSTAFSNCHRRCDALQVQFVSG